MGGGLEGGELAVGVEDVELGIVLAEGGAGVCGGSVVDGLGGTLALADGEGFEDGQELVAVGGEILENVDGAALVAEDGDEVDGGHLGAEELLGGFEGADLVAGTHGGHVEVEGEEALVFVLVGGGRFGADLGAGQAFVEAGVLGGGLRFGQEGGGVGEGLALDEADGLGGAVFGDGEVFRGEAGDEVALLVLDGDGLDDELGLDGEGVGLGGVRVLVGRRRSGLPEAEVGGGKNGKASSS